MVDIRKAIKVAMASKGIDTQAQLAEKAEMTRQQLGQWLAKDESAQHRSPNLNSLERIADALSMKVSDLVALGE